MDVHAVGMEKTRGRRSNKKNWTDMREAEASGEHEARDMRQACTTRRETKTGEEPVSNLNLGHQTQRARVGVW
jgi:hypothetical protein